MALSYAEKSNAFTYYRKAYLLENLARVLSELGRFEEAAEQARAAMPRAKDLGDTTAIGRLKDEAEAFARHRKYSSLAGGKGV